MYESKRRDKVIPNFIILMKTEHNHIVCEFHQAFDFNDHLTETDDTDEFRVSCNVVSETKHLWTQTVKRRQIFFGNTELFFVDHFLFTTDIPNLKENWILNLDQVHTERFRYAPKRNEVIVLVRIDLTATITQIEELHFASERSGTVPSEHGLSPHSLISQAIRPLTLVITYSKLIPKINKPRSQFLTIPSFL